MWRYNQLTKVKEVLIQEQLNCHHLHNYQIIISNKKSHLYHWIQQIPIQVSIYFILLKNESEALREVSLLIKKFGLWYYEQ